MGIEVTRPAKASGARSSAEAPSKARRIFGLSIDEKIRWASSVLSAKITEAGLSWPDLEANENHDKWELPPDEDVEIHGWLRAKLEALKKHRPELFVDVQAVGVSCIGVIVEDKSGRKCLSRIYRKPHWKPRPDGVVIDFNELFSGLFDVDIGVLGTAFLTVRNDATAKAVSEAANIPSIEYPFVFINLDVGLNCGILVDYGSASKKEGEVFKAALHPEFGHARPMRHPDDRFVDLAHSGCPKHSDCYEALASGGRMIARWGKSMLEPNHEQWEFVAFYIAQACFTITMLLSPYRIVVGGYLASDWLIERIKDEFFVLNNGYIVQLDPDNLIQRSSIDPTNFDILAALQVALAHSWLGPALDWSNIARLPVPRKG